MRTTRALETWLLLKLVRRWVAEVLLLLERRRWGAAELILLVLWRLLLLILLVLLWGRHRSRGLQSLCQRYFPPSIMSKVQAMI